MYGSFRVGRIFGIPVRLHWSLLAIGGLLAFQLADGLLPDAHPGHSTATYTAVGAAAAVVFFVTVLAHELAHALTARRYSMPVESIDLWALGGVTRLRSAARSPKAEWRIAAAGPLMSLLCAAVFALAAYIVEHGPGRGLIPIALWWLAVVNAILAVFNALPAAPLDGGRVLSGVLWRMNGDRFRASQTAAIAGWMLGWLLTGLGVALIVRHDDGIFICFLGLFLVGASRTEQHAAELRGSIAGTRVRDVTWFGVAHASGETEARTMLRQRLRMGGLGVVAVHDEDGRVTGYVSEGQLVRARDGGKGHTPLKTLAVPADRVGRAELDEELSDALSRIQPRLPMVAVWDSEQLVGIVANDAVEERFAGRTDG
jgi:Zn-dependent protease